MNSHERRIFIGYSPEELIPATIAEDSIRRTADLADGQSLRITKISKEILGPYYTRRTIRTAQHQRYDVISQAPMSTDHAIARFFIPWLCDYSGWALFVDGDILCRRSITELFEQASPAYAVMCVWHPPLLAEGAKKDGTAFQLAYPRKNWSSVMLFNCGHAANRQLDLDLLNTWPGRDLHAFKWLADEQVGNLDPSWNYLVNVNPPQASPSIVHFTEGVPLLRNHLYDPYAEEWYAAAALAGFRLPAPQPALD